MKLARIAGIRFRVNLLFFLLAILYTVLGMGKQVLLIIAAVLLHELAHTIAGAFMGIKVSEIELFPFGGQAQTEDFTGLEPVKEIYVALAGPLASMILAAVFYFLSTNPHNPAVTFFVWINVCLGGFNLLPVLPLDGGRVLRACLSWRRGYRQATLAAARMGKIVAVGLGLYGTYLSITRGGGAQYIFVGIFLFWAAHREENLLVYSFFRFLVRKKTELVSRGLMEAKQVVSKGDTQVRDVLYQVKPSYYMLVYVVDESYRVTGMCTEAQLIEGLLEKGPATTVQDCL